MSWKSNRFWLVRAVCFAAVRILLQLLYVVPWQSEVGDFRFYVFGGIEVEMSFEAIWVILAVLADFMFYLYVGTYFVRELKENFILIIFRTTKKKIWIRKAIACAWSALLCYELISLLFAQVCHLVWDETGMASWKEVLVVFCVDLAGKTWFLLWSNFCVMVFQESLAVLALLFSQILPILWVGFFASQNMQQAVKNVILYLPFQWENYHYLCEAQLSPLGMAGAMSLLCVAGYGVLQVCFQKQEWR